MATAAPPLLSAHDLGVDYGANASLWGRHRRLVQPALQGVSLEVHRGEVLAVVGESGSGKSTLGRALVQLTRPTQGVVRVDDVVITEMWRRRAWGEPTLSRAFAPYRRKLQMVFQDPHASLDSTQPIGAAIAEPMHIHRLGDAAQRAQRVAELLAEVGLHPAFAERWPHALSGGQRQRVGIARALATEPVLLVADEPTSALDVSVKGHILFVFERLVVERNLALVLISHDLAAVRYISHRTLVMYRGQVIESGPTADVLGAPQHPYTSTLLAAAPSMQPAVQRAKLHATPIAQPHHEPPQAGCVYAPRCPRRVPVCDVQAPALVRHGADDHATACHVPAV